MKLQHISLAIFITAIWGINFSVIKIGLATIPPLTLAGIRFFLCAVPLVFFIKKPDVSWGYIISYGLVFGVCLWGIVNLSMKVGLSAGITSLLLQFSAFFSILLGALIFRERLNKYKIIGIIIAILGLICIITITDGSITLPGVMLVIIGAIAWSIANAISKKSNTKEVFSFLIWSSVFSPLPLFLLDLYFNGINGYILLINNINFISICSILFQVYPNTLLAYWIWNSLLRQYPVSSVAPLSLLVPVFGILGSVLIFNETIIATKFLAIVLIIIGLIVGLYGERIGNIFFKSNASQTIN